MRIYPNPFKGFLDLESDSEIDEIKIYTSSGRLIRVYDVARRKARLDLSGLPPACYLLRIESEGSVENHRIIKLE